MVSYDTSAPLASDTNTYLGTSLIHRLLKLAHKKIRLTSYMNITVTLPFFFDPAKRKIRL